MTINVNTSRNEYTATSGQTVFNFTFKIYTATDLNVYVTPAGQECNDVTDLTEAYTVTGVGLEDGGSITLNTGAGANDLVTIASAIPTSRTTDYQSNGDFTPETVNNDIDRAISLIKQVESKADRSLLSSECLQGPKPLTLPKPESGDFMRWKTDLSGLENVSGENIASGIIVDTDYVKVFNTGYFKVLNTVADMIADTSLVVGQTVITLGYNSVGDRGGNAYLIVAASTGVDDGGSYIDLDTYQAKGLFNGPLNVKQFGAVGDGVTDDTAAITSSIALGGVVNFPSGTYLITSYSITPPSNTYLLGEGQGTSVIKFNSTTTTSKVDFDTSNGDITFEALTIEHDGVVSETCQIIGFYGSRVTVKNCEITSQDSATVDTATNAFHFNSSVVEDIKVLNCFIHQINRVILRPNATTGITTNVTFDGNTIQELGEGGVQFNYPNGAIAGVKITNNYFKNFYTGGEQIFCGGASLKDAVISNNVFRGTGKECVHLEEGGENVVISGNVFNIDGHGLTLGDNNVGGSYKTPTNISITGNTFLKDGAKGKTAMRMPSDGAGLNSYEQVVINGNTISGYSYGMELGYGSLTVGSNIITDCTYGIKSNSVSPSVAGNSFIDCTIGVTALIYSGLVGKNNYRNCATVANTVATDNNKVALSGFIVQIEDDVNLPASTVTNVDVGIPVGAEMYGEAKVVCHLGAVSFRNRISTIDYDGSTLTDTELMMNGSGSIIANGFVNNAGELSFALNNTTGSAVTLKNMIVEFEGMWVSST